MEHQDPERDSSLPAARIALATLGLLLTLLVVAALVRPDMVMPVLHMIMHGTRTMTGL